MLPSEAEPLGSVQEVEGVPMMGRRGNPKRVMRCTLSWVRVDLDSTAYELMTLTAKWRNSQCSIEYDVISCIVVMAPDLISLHC